MLSVLIGKKCIFCGERGKNLNSIGGYGIYYNERKHFHQKCLKDIICDPEHYKHTQVDIALDILEKRKEEEAKAVFRRKNFKNKCEKLAEYCVSPKEGCD